jgi:DNA-binding transcriptional LysR family regulator
MVASSDAIGAAMLTQIRDELESGALCLLPVHTPWLRLNYGFIRRRDSTVSAGALEFMAALQERETALNTQEAELRRRFGRPDPALP